MYHDSWDITVPGAESRKIPYVHDVMAFYRVRVGFWEGNEDTIVDSHDPTASINLRSRRLPKNVII